MTAKNWKTLVLCLAVLFAAPNRTGAEEPLPPMPEAPLFLTSVTPAQLTADYWINRLPNPDRVLISPSQLETFNEDIHHMIKDCMDVLSMGEVFLGKDLEETLSQVYGAVSNRKLFDKDGQRIPREYFTDQIRPRMNFEKIPSSIRIRWGAAMQSTSVRSIPTEKKMLEAPDDIEFDQLQFSLIKLWTPVAIYHTSSDGRWYYIQAPYVRGWVHSEDITVFPDRAELKQYASAAKFLMVTGESIQIYDDMALTQRGLRPTMGTRIPIQEEMSNVYSVWLPSGSKGASSHVRKAYILKREDVHEGFPAYTQRNVITQAFKLLGERYGWGGMYNGRDCSGFTHDVFLSFGIAMPRDSSEQGYIGIQLSHFEPYQQEDEKKYFLRHATEGITLIAMPMHMMLYLGEVNGKFYVIHSTWAERISMTSDEKRRINQVVVSDMSLNGDSYLGSLLDRTISINEVQ